MANQRTGDDDMPGYRTGPAFKNEKRDYGWTPYDDRKGLSLSNHVLAAPAGWYMLWLIEDQIIYVPIVAWELYDDGKVEYLVLYDPPEEIEASAILTPDGRVIGKTLFFPEDGKPKQKMFASPAAWADWEKTWRDGE